MDAPNIFELQDQEFRRLERRFRELRRKYDQYFLGMEKREPGLLREQLDRDLRNCKLNAALQTTLRFRYQQFMARYRTYATQWDRILREMEAGTYRRGAVTQAERLLAQQADAALKRAEGLDPATGRPTGTDAPEEPADATADQRRLRSASTSAQQFLSAMMEQRKTGSSSGDNRALYESYLRAKRDRGEDVSKINFTAFSRTVDQQRERAQAKVGDGVRLRVKITDEKVTLVASRKKRR